MPPIEMPMNTAHQHAANAEEHLSNGLLVPASQEHLKAAEAYLAAVERTQDDSTKRTLQMLYNEHRKAGSELEKKIARLREEGKDPNVPQIQKPGPDAPKLLTTPLSAFPARTVPSPPPRHLTDSQGTVDESFMLLGGQKSDPGDAFNQFWNIMQGMLDNLSQPVAFATVPLVAESSETGHGGSQENTVRRPSLSSDTDFTDVEEPMVSRLTRKLKMGGGSVSGKGKEKAGTRTGERLAKTEECQGDFDEDLFDEGDDLSESFFLIPSESTMRAMKQENTALKNQVESLQRRLEATERILQVRKEQDMMLRDSIVQASKEAQRVMSASILGAGPGRPPLDLANMNMNLPPLTPAGPIPGINTAREAQYARRVKELEDELRNMRIENDKNKAMIAKFRERWEKLKESAKKKKEAKEAARTGVREQIIEEPEEEDVPQS
ncbi:hypothetical protein Moror_8904 [Moniliophthora roreri MCA 2997]|uniref:Uncharacterized protein n=2 Tax=Moniliophthora roreri TaxID=221103 RepID=V2XJG2_MONRO|nr:hypothetical protein Moror_8904 [Moniliophthora roreri MCA 2997]KAI3610871.1 hypothetical protein WG66_007171 [Moniliophthora roreri]